MAPARSEQDHWVLIILLEKLRRIVDSEFLAPGERLLDYGCRDKPYQDLFRKKFKHHIGADLPGGDADLIVDSQGHLPSADQYFDCVLSTQVLEHVENPGLYLKEAYRVLKTGGSLILSTHGFWHYHPDPTDYWRWTIDGLQRQIRQAGFDIVMLQSVLGPESSALQLWQNATSERLPSSLQRIYVKFIQRIIGIIERRQPDKISNDASVYVILARKN